MSSRPTFVVKGDKELIANLDRLKGSVKKKITRRAVTAAIRPIRMEAKANVPTDTKQLKKQLTVKVKSYKTGNVIGIVGVRNEKNEATGRRPSKYLHLVVKGTKAHTITAKKRKVLVATDDVMKKTIRKRYLGKTVRHPGSKANDFLTPAITGKQGEALAKFSEIMAAGILAEARKTS